MKYIRTIILIIIIYTIEGCNIKPILNAININESKIKLIKIQKIIIIIVKIIII
jgi:hypothetical protein